MSCQKEGLIEKTQTDEPLVFTASIASDQTKTTLSGDSPAKIYWEATDYITITDASSHTAVYMVSSGAGTSTATFIKKSGDDLDNPGTYTATYGSAPSTSQIYMASGSVPLHMTAPSTSSTDGLKFTAQCGVLRVTLTDATHQIMRVEVSNGTNTYNVTATSPVAVTSATNFYLALPAGTYTTMNIYDNNGQMVSMTGISLVITAGHLKPAGNTSALSFTTGTKGFKDGHFAVQLWSGGPFWAETNIGAVTETDCGYYFAWGYTEGCVRNFENTGWVLASDGTTAKQFNTTDFPYRAPAAFQDAATTAWGTGWSVPINTMLQALTGCSIVSDSSGGVRITGKATYASNSIYFPAVGYGNGTTLDNWGYGFYWSSNEYTEDSAWFFNLNETYYYGGYKQLGFPVRPVCTAL